jgi:hypothetical protein
LKLPVYCAIFATFITFDVAVAKAQVVFSSSFDEDDTGYFSYSGPPSGGISFDPSRGSSAPGSLRLTRIESFQSAAATAPCLQFDPSQRYVFRADSLRETLGQCQISYELFLTPDCSGDVYLEVDGIVPGSPDLSPDNPNLGTWTLLNTFAGTSYLGQEEFRSIRFRMVLSGQVPAACNFDDVLITASQRIPSVGRPGLVAMLVLVTLVALLLLHRAP